MKVRLAKGRPSRWSYEGKFHALTDGPTNALGQDPTLCGKYLADASFFVTGTIHRVECRKCRASLGLSND